MQLRRLPKPKVPEDMEAKLIAAIPPAARAGRRNRWAIWLWMAGAGVAAAAVLAFSVVSSYWQARDVAGPLHGSNAQQANSVSTQLASDNAKETDPCAILPPLSDWH
jgi:hypothetical protein